MAASAGWGICVGSTDEAAKINCRNDSRSGAGLIQNNRIVFYFPADCQLRSFGVQSFENNSEMEVSAHGATWATGDAESPAGCGPSWLGAGSASSTLSASSRHFRTAS
jgi:hypothetical protein